MNSRIFLALALAAATVAAAAERQEAREFSVNYAISSCSIDSLYGSNAAGLAALDSLLSSGAAAPDASEIRSIIVSGCTSPDGPQSLNERLGRKRRDAFIRYISTRYPEYAPRIVTGESVIAWQQLMDHLEASTEPWRDDALAILRDTPAPGGADTRNARLKRLRGGKAWRTLAQNYYGPLRSATATALLVFPEPEPEPEAGPAIGVMDMDECDTVRTDTVVTAVTDSVVRVADERPNRYWALTSNMLYDVLAVPNIGVEAYIGKHWSVAANWQYAWWNSRPRSRYWRTYGGWVGARRWFGSKAHAKPLQGHHLGIYAQMLLYDFEWGGKGYLSGEPGKNIFHHPTWGGGIEYGYSLPIARRLNLDFSIGIGYLTGRYLEYEPRDGHFAWLCTKNRHYFGPTRLEVSLVWLLGHGNRNARKGDAK